MGGLGWVFVNFPGSFVLWRRWLAVGDGFV